MRLKSPIRIGQIPVLLACSLAAHSARAAENSPYQFTAAYAQMRVDAPARPLHLEGIRFALARTVNSWLAIEGEGGGYHLEGFRLGTIMAGPRLAAYARHGFSAYAHALAGWAHADAAARGLPSYHDSAAWAAGGGIELRLSRRVGLNLAQLDYLQTRLRPAPQHNLRAGAGVVFHFGGLRK